MIQITYLRLFRFMLVVDGFISKKNSLIEFEIKIYSLLCFIRENFNALGYLFL